MTSVGEWGKKKISFGCEPAKIHKKKKKKTNHKKRDGKAAGTLAKGRGRGGGKKGRRKGGIFSGDPILSMELP